MATASTPWDSESKQKFEQWQSLKRHKDHLHDVVIVNTPLIPLGFILRWRALGVTPRAALHRLVAKPLIPLVAIGGPLLVWAACRPDPRPPLPIQRQSAAASSDTTTRNMYLRGLDALFFAPVSFLGAMHFAEQDHWDHWQKEATTAAKRNLEKGVGLTNPRSPPFRFGIPAAACAIFGHLMSKRIQGYISMKERKEFGL